MANLNRIMINGTSLLDQIYPVGALYTSSKSTDPGTIFGGTWTRIKGKMIVGLDENDSDFKTVKATGGEKTHRLSAFEMPDHHHDLPAFVYGDTNLQGDFTIKWDYSGQYKENSKWVPRRTRTSDEGGGSSQQYASICGILYVGAYRLKLLNQIFLKYVKEVWCNG